jgi:hypothetical protein
MWKNTVLFISLSKESHLRKRRLTDLHAVPGNRLYGSPPLDPRRLFCGVTILLAHRAGLR